MAELPSTAGLTDVHALHLVEPGGVRTYLVLVVDGRASVVRLTIVRDLGQSGDEMDRALDEVVGEWEGRLAGLSPAEQRRFAAAVDETSDPYVLLEDVVRGEPLASITPKGGCEGGDF